MKLVSWNVNGIRAAIKKGFKDIVLSLNCDVISIQEIKCHEFDDSFDINGFTLYTFPAKRKGYSGTAIYTKQKPVNIEYGIGIDEFDDEGRTLIMEFNDFYLLNSYTPNAQPELARIDYRLRYDKALVNKMNELQKNKPCILCGDLNVAHKEIDLKNPKANEKNPGYSIEERTSFDEILSNGYIDTYRHINPDKIEQYTWWSYRFGARARNIGWRIDYFVISSSLKSSIKEVGINQEIMGSDHCPVYLVIDKK